MTLTGTQILALLEQQWSAAPGGTEKVTLLAVSNGFSYAWDGTRPLGSRVVPDSVRVAGEALVGDRSYRVTCNSFLATGGDGFSVFAAGTDRLGGALDLDALERYFGVHAPVEAPAAGRVTRADL
jgi:5'-nucleotidase